MSFCVLILSIAASAQLSGLTAGRIDRSYGEGGAVLPGCCTGMIGYSDSIDLPENKILFLGTMYTASGISIVLTRHLATGELDQTFGDKGIAIHRFGSDLWAGSVRRQLDGKLVIAASTMVSETPVEYDFAVIRLLENGDLDTSFATGGIFTKDFAENQPNAVSSDNASGVAALNDGKIIIGGLVNRYNSANTDQRATSFATIIRLTASGDLDTSFGTGGQTLVKVGNNLTGTSSTRPTTLRQLPDNKILVGSSVDQSRQSDPKSFYLSGMLTRFNADGSLDTTFATNGVLNVAPEQWSGISAIVFQPDGKYLVSAISSVVRVLRQGTFDQTFGNGGRVEVPQLLSDIILQPDGKILTSDSPGGWVIGASEFQIGSVRRLNANGSTDIRFGRGGVSYFRHNQTPLGFGRIHLRDNYMIVAGIINIPSMTQMFTRFHLGK